jgi:hypothetical protein
VSGGGGLIIVSPRSTNTTQQDMKRYKYSFLFGIVLVLLGVVGEKRLLGVHGFVTSNHHTHGTSVPCRAAGCEHHHRSLCKRKIPPAIWRSSWWSSSLHSSSSRTRSTTFRVSADKNENQDNWNKLVERDQNEDDDDGDEPSRRRRHRTNWNDWIATGLSAVFLAQFGSLYTQLPGLFGTAPHGLLPIADRITSLDDQLWIMNSLPTSSPEWAMEMVCVTGFVVAAAQLVMGPRLQTKWPGLFTYGILWFCWHDLIVSGGRFLQYQMDTLLLDVAPIVLIGCWSDVANKEKKATAAAAASTFGYRWLLARLYLGAGSVKLLSCDASWRDLSAVHWHFQSQPLPNGVGVWAYEHVPLLLSQALTWGVLVGEMAAPFLFLAPSKRIRQVAFVGNVLLMVGIGTFGNFGSLQALLIIVGFSLLAEDGIEYTADDAVVQGTEGGNQRVFNNDNNKNNDKTNSSKEAILLTAVSTVSLALAAAGAFWAVQDIGASCIDTLPIEPLVYDFIALGTLVALLPLLMNALGGNRNEGGGDLLATSALSLFLVASSVTTLGVDIPFEEFWDQLNIGAQRYGLFATMTGVGGRPVAVIEAATSGGDISGASWNPIPFLYQVNDPSRSLPFCFPHFPRLDWTLWFIPTGESGLWIARLFQGITSEDPAILGLLDKTTFKKRFPIEPPAIVRVVAKVYEWEDSQWQVINGPRYNSDTGFPVIATYKRGGLYVKNNHVKEDSSSSTAWPSTPLIRPLASSMRPEYFIWASLGTSAAARCVIQESIVTDWPDED